MTEEFVRKNVLRLRPYVPGKPIEEVERELGITDIIKMASNENALGPSPKAIEAMKKSLEDVALYPDGNCYQLRLAVAKHCGVEPDNLIFGNGSDDIIHMIGLTFLQQNDECLQGDVTFSQYEAAATLNDCGCCMVPMKDFTFDVDAMADRITENTKLIFIANPNNPTGTMVTQKEMERLLARMPERCFLVMDEAYYEYVESDEYPRSIEWVKEGRNVIVLRTFSKIYALAGLRVGYGIARPDIVGYINRVREPFNVNSVAMAGAIASLEDPDQVKRSRELNSSGKKYLCAEFDRMGLPYSPSEANFIWVDVKKDSVKVFKEMLKRGVIIRTGDIFGAPTHIRVTMGTKEQNERFIAALAEVLA
ncbi:MAG: histidinol-phosphate transaminase [Armatimonadota bacterium]|nr:histidinol-phosphate transaminase [Armatimonadota bacterium]